MKTGIMIRTNAFSKTYKVNVAVTDKNAAFYKIA